MTREQVDAIIQKEYEDFRDKKYSGPPLPERLLYKFMTALKIIPKHMHKVDSNVAKTIIAKTDESELTMYEAGIVMNTVALLSFEAQEYENLTDALDDDIDMQEIMAKYNAATKKKGDELEARRNSMYELGGAIPHNNSRLKIK